MLGGSNYVEALLSPNAVQQKNNKIKITRLIERYARNTVVGQFTNEIRTRLGVTICYSFVSINLHGLINLSIAFVKDNIFENMPNI